MVASSYDRLVDRLHELVSLGSIASLVDWDQETMMPRGGAAVRSSQREALAGVIHEKMTDSEMCELVASLREEVGEEVSDRAIVVRETGRQLDRLTKVPNDLVKAVAKLESESLSAWLSARKGDDFASFAPLLEKMIDLKKQVGEAIGYETTVYDAFLEEFEPGARSEDLAAMLEQLSKGLVPLVQDIVSNPRPLNDRMTRGFDAAAQKEFALEVIAKIGFDLEGGRLDESSHPFCQGLHPGDVRMTTRYNEDFRSALYGAIHEAGHGLYEQGLDPSTWGTPLSQWASMGVHESQSRLWENIVGRSRAFWAYFLPAAQKRFPSLADCTVDEMYHAVNEVQESLIRVEADEVTYNLHIILRFEIEQALLRGDLSVADLPSAWNDKMKSLLGVVPPNDADGCLQDIHWSMGAFGYFPSYTLGNVYASMIWTRALEDLPDLDAGIEKGDMIPLRDWLREHVHRHGRRFSGPELIERITGRSPTVDDVLGYLKSKYRPLYGLS